MIRPTTLCLSLFITVATGTSFAAPANAWTSADIGGPALPGSGVHATDGWKLTAGGTDIWGAADQFHYAFQQRTGDFDVAVRTLEFKPAHLYSKVGLMARESLSADSRHVYLMVFADNKPRNKNNGGFEFQFREVAGGPSKAIYPVIKPDSPAEFPVGYPDVWLRLQRRGNEFSAFASTDGKNWKPYAHYTLELPPKLFLGVALTSHNAKASATAACSDVLDVN